jgi:hypothetical protein
VDKEEYYWWLEFDDIMVETDSTIVAAHDQAVGTNYFKKHFERLEC